ncbi:formylglycine-generating enzyme family protein [Pseudovibrio ascidiaceicola]|uniref:formylglycine-generating enzyme family protein n=1 Tax=Pseudovibrio ascidiaceicola TaxID=285279 RepID=UPI003D368D1C
MDIYDSDLEKIATIDVSKRLGYPARVTETMITNDMMCSWLNNLPVQNVVGGMYLLLNTVNSNNPISFNSQIGKYITRSKELADHPVVGVTWFGAALFCYSAGGRLLTEPEWQTIASNEENFLSEYPFEGPPNANVANYGNLQGGTTPVKMFPPNRCGLYDMAGNVREWTSSKYVPEKNTKNVVGNMHALVKGGAWDKTSAHLKIGTRAGKFERIGTSGIGFRLLVL